MKTTVIPGVERFGLVIAGPLAEARQRAGEYFDNPLRNIFINGYGAIHADAFTTGDVLAEWFASNHDITVPGTLLFYKSKEH